MKDANGHGREGEEVPPHDLDAEIAVLGSMLLDAAVLDGIAKILSPGDFYREPHADVFVACWTVRQSGALPDIVLVRDELQSRGVLERVGGTAFLARVVASVPTAANGEHYARIVRRKSIDRQEWAAACRLRSAQAEDDEGAAENARAELDRAKAARTASENEAAPAFAFVSLREIHATPIETPPWFVPSLVGRKRLTLLVGQPKAGKSLSAQGLATVLAAGLSGTWLGTDFTASAGDVVVAYVCAEGGLALIRDRSLILARNSPDDALDRFHVLGKRPFPRLDDPRHLDALRRDLERIRADVLILDPMARLRALENENDNAAGMRLAVALRELTEDLNLATMLVHHPGRSGMADGASGSLGGGRGASVLLGEVDAAVSLRRDAKKGETHASFEIREGAAIEPGRRLVVNPETLWLDFVGPLGPGSGRAPSGAAVPTVSDDQLVAALRAAGRPLKRDEWAAAAGMSGRNLGRRVPALFAAKSIETSPGPRNSVLFALRAPSSRTTQATLPLSGRGSAQIQRSHGETS